MTDITPRTVSMCPSADYAKGWNDCLKAVTAAKPSPELKALADGWRANYDNGGSCVWQGCADQLEAVLAGAPA